MKVLLIIFIGTMFLLNGLSPIPLASFNFFIAAAIFPFVFLSKMPKQYNFREDNTILAMMFAWGIFAWILYPAPVEFGRFQGALQWLASFLILWVGVRRWIVVSKITFGEVSRAAFYGSLALAMFVILEYYLANTRGEYLSDFIPFSIEDFPEADLFFTGGVRPRGFAAEAGFTSIVFECLVPLAVFHFRRIALPLSVAYCGFCALALVLLYSTTTFLAAGIAMLFLFVARLNSRGAVQIFIGVCVVSYLISANAQFLYEASGYKIFELIDALGTDYTYTSGSRQEAWAAGVSIFLQHPFGSGWGTVLQEAKNSGSEVDQMLAGTGLISLWLELLVAVGFVPFLIFMTRLVRLLLRLARSSRREAHLCFLSLTTVTLHHFGVYELWFPMVWFSLALSQVVLVAVSEPRLEARKIPSAIPPSVRARHA